jgi:crotonobetaine/carnitine-CoA ligase
MDRTYESVQASLAPEVREAETVAGALAAAVSVRPDAPYLTFAETGETYTVSELDEAATAMAEGLSDLGVGKGDRVGVYLKNSPLFVEAAFACAKLGAVQVPVNPDYREREVRHAFDTAGISVCLAESEDAHVEILAALAPDFDAFGHVVLAGGDPGPLSDVDGVETHREPDLDGPALPGVGVGPEDPFTVIYTSGTTGLPKPALIPHRSYLLSGKSFVPALSDGVNYNPFPLFHGNNQYYSMVGPLLAGSEWLLGRRFTASRFREHVETYRVTSFNVLGGTPKLLLSAYDEFPETTLEVAIGPIGTETWERFEERFGLRVVQIYSQTESPTLLMNHPDPARIRKGSIGKPMFPDLGHEAAVLDRDGEPAPAGEEGELTRTDPGAMLGYFRMPERTEETLREGRIFSGDVVREDEDGYFYYVDRVKFMIRRSGENIAPREVEEVIDELEGVEESAVVPVPDETRGEEVKALVKRSGERAGDGEVTERDVVLQVARNLAAHKVPRYVEFVGSFPKTPSERIQRVQLAEAERERDSHGWDRELGFRDWEESI